MTSRDTDWRTRLVTLLGHSLALAAVAALPFVLLGPYYNMIGVAVVLFGYLIAMGWREHRNKNKRSKPKWQGFRPEARTTLFVVLVWFSALIGAGVLAGGVYAAWLRLAYRSGRAEQVIATLREGASIEPLGQGINPVDLLQGLGWSALLLALAFLTMKWARPFRVEPVGERIRTYGIGAVLPLWAIGAEGVGMFIVGVPLLMVMLFLPFVVGDALASAGLDWIDIMPAALPLGLVPIAMFVISMPDAFGTLRYNVNMLVLGDPGGEDLAEDSRTPAPQAGYILSALGFAGAIAYFLWFFHWLIVVATSVVPALTLGAVAGGELQTWLFEELDKGRPAQEIVAEIESAGQWNPASPGEGLANLLPGLDDDFTRSELADGCRIGVAAALAAPDEQAAMAWPPEAFGKDVEEPVLPLERPNSVTVKFCLSATCPSPAAWDEPGGAALYSSHPTHQPGWLHFMYFDLQAAGRAPGPAGYCNADGTLADSYQG